MLKYLDIILSEYADYRKLYQFIIIVKQTYRPTSAFCPIETYLGSQDV